MADEGPDVGAVAKKRRQFRRRRHSSDSEDTSEKEGIVSAIVGDTKVLQKLRKRQLGVDVVDLNVAKNVPEKKKITSKDPFTVETGGFIDMKSLKNRNPSEDSEVIGTTFAAETNRRDEDADMLKYVEEELARRKGAQDGEEEKKRRLSNKLADPLLMEVPEYLRTGTGRKTEDMLSNQMLSGIPEVDLGIEAKIKNIEATEDAKQKMIDDRKRKKERVSEFVPTNMAVNFVQHNRFNIEDSAPILKPAKKEEPKLVPVRVGDVTGEPVIETKKGTSKDKSSDDFHFEKFKKHNRR